MGRLMSSWWFIFSTYLITLIRFLARQIFSFNGKKNWVGTVVAPQEEEEQVDTINEILKHFEWGPDVFEFKESEYDGFGEKETPSFEFKFPTLEDSKRSDEASQESVEVGDASPAMTTISNYRFLSEKGVVGFVKEPKVMSFSIEESYVGEDKVKPSEELEEGFVSMKDFHVGELNLKTVASDVCADEKSKDDFVSKKDFHVGELNLEIVSADVWVDEEFKDESVSKKDFHVSELNLETVVADVCADEEKKPESEPPCEDKLSLKEGFIGPVSDGFPVLAEMDFFRFVSDADSIDSSDGYSVKNLNFESNSDCFLSEKDFSETEQEMETMGCPELGGEAELMEDLQRLEQSLDMGSSEDMINVIDGNLLEPKNRKTEDVQELMEDLQRLEQSLDMGSSEDLINVIDGNLFEPKNRKTEDVQELMEDLQRLEQSIDVSCSENMHDVIDGSLFESENRETGDVQDRKVAEDPEIDIEQFDETLLDRIIDECQSEENSEDLESEWEHQDLIEQLKMELKKVRSIGLPTILEESESLKSIEDLKPWKMDEKFLHEDPMDELHKFYKCYRERMRKFDILNYQKMYAMGFLRLKDPLQSTSSQRTLFPMISSILSHNLWLCNRRRSNGDMSTKFIKELQSDLEVVYVGQACLSWEFLCWQYQKAWELPESDRYGVRQYNQVAGEFQQFQVLLHRFLEDEAFQGPRVQNYAKNRCVLRKLIQVPVIKDDSLNERKGDDGMSNEALRVVMWDSIRVFWEFIKGDKGKTSTILKGLMRAQPELQDLVDSELMSEVQAHLQKKEKRLKDLLRVGNCIVKNFQHKHEEDVSDQALFFSQVDIKLVARVLRMSRITSEQLGWCQEKLNRIAFVGRKAHRETSFMPFPC